MRIILFLLLIIPIQLFAQTISYISDPNGRIREHNVDFIHLRLTLDIIPEQGLLHGKAEYTFSPKQMLVDSVFLDGPGILVKSISVNNSTTRFKSDSAGITIFFNPALMWETENTLAIEYTAKPKKGLYFIGWDVQHTAEENDPDKIRNQIWSQGQGTDNRFWIPGYDDENDKLISEMIITFDKNYKVNSNGKLISTLENRDNKTSTWHYAMDDPHAFYLMQLSIGDYAIKKYTSKSGVEISQYYYPGGENTIESTYGYSDEMMDWMETEVGVPYPWEIYSNVPVQNFLYGAMENTTATIFTDYYLQDERSAPDRNYYATNAHELAHQWFGDYVTEWSATHHWLHESFATHYAKKFMQYKFGEDFFQWKRREEMISAFAADAKDEFPLAHSQAGGSRHYPKGSVILDMLRYVVGDTQYRKAVKEYLEKYAFGSVTTHDFYLQFAETLGLNLDWFFDEWIYKAGYPEYTVSYSAEVSTTHIQVMQTHKETQTVGLFKMPIIIQVHYTDGSVDEKKAWIENEKTTVVIPNTFNKQIAFVLFDPNSMVYASVNFNKEYAELRYQAFNAPNMMDRFDALTDMRNIPLDKKRDDLIALYANENWHGMKAEILTQLANDNNKESVNIFSSALRDEDVLVRRAAISNVSTINKKLQNDYESILNDFNYTNIEIALRTLCIIDPDNTKHYLELTKDEMGMNKNIRTAWIELQGKNVSEKHLAELVHYTSASYEFRTRIYAINSLLVLNYCDEILVKNLFNGITSFNYRLTSPSRKALQTFLQQAAYKDMILKVYAENVCSEDEQKRISDILNN